MKSRREPRDRAADRAARAAESGMRARAAESGMRARAAETGMRARPPAGFWSLWVTVAIDLVGFGIVLPILPIYARHLHVSNAAAALLVAAFSAASFVASPLWGRLSDRIGRKPVLVASLIGTAVGSLLTGVAGGLLLLMIGRVVDGGSGGSVGVAQAAVADVADPADRPRLFGYLGAAFGIGFVAGPAIGALAALGSARLPFYVAAAIAGANALVAAVRLPSRPVTTAEGPAAGAARQSGTRDTGRPADEPGGDAGRPADKPGGGALGGSWSTLLRRHGQLLSVTFLATTAFSAFEATFSLFGSHHLGFGIGSAAAVFAGIGAAMVIVQGGLVHPLVSRLGEDGTLGFGLVLNIVGLALLAVSTSWAFAGPALAALAIGQGLAQTTMSSALARRGEDRQRGALLGLQQSASSLARIVGPALGGALIGASATGWPFTAGAGLTAVAAVLFLAVRRPGGPGPGRPVSDSGVTSRAAGS